MNMNGNEPEFAERDRHLHAGSEVLIGQMIANRDQLEAFHRDARGRRKAEIAKHLEVADKNLFEFRSSFEVFTEHLINRGVLPESKRGRPVLENDPRTNAEKMGLSPDSPVFDGVRGWANETAAPGPRKAASADPTRSGPADPKGSGPGGTATPEKQAKAKSLPIGTPDVIQAAATGTKGDPEEGVAGAATRGFIGGASAGIRANLRSDNPAQDKETRRAPARNAEGQSQQDPKAKSLPKDTPDVIQVAAAGTGARPDEGVAEAAARGFIGGASAGIRASLRSDSDPAPDKKARSAPVRNAEGQSLQDLTAQKPGEDALPGTTQPFALDIVDAVQGKPAPRVAMNPEHAASLEAMDVQQDDGMDRGVDRYGR